MVRPFRVLITRPRDDAAPLAAALEAGGVQTLVDPLLVIRHLPGPPPALTGVAGLVATSANGIRAFARRSSRRDVRVFAVGDATARTAHEAGFDLVESADGDVDALAALIESRVRPDDGDLLHVAGTDVAGDLAGRLRTAGFACRREVLYRAETVTCLPPASAAALADGTLDGVAVLSPRTASTFRRLVQEADLSGACRRLTAFCLSQAVADRLRQLPWHAVAVATHPHQHALVTLICDNDGS